MSAVTLRRTRPDDFEAYFRWFSDAEVFAYLPQKIFGPIDLKASRDYLARISREERPELALIVECDGRAVGFATIRDFDAVGGAEAGLVIGEPALWGQGIGLAAMEALLQLAYRTLGLNRVRLTVNEKNERALRLYAALGFAEVGRQKEWVFMTHTSYEKVGPTF